MRHAVSLSNLYAVDVVALICEAGADVLGIVASVNGLVGRDSRPSLVRCSWSALEAGMMSLISSVSLYGARLGSHREICYRDGGLTWFALYFTYLAIHARY